MAWIGTFTKVVLRKLAATDFLVVWPQCICSAQGEVLNPRSKFEVVLRTHHLYAYFLKAVMFNRKVDCGLREL